jgi:hypothetical protein
MGVEGMNAKPFNLNQITLVSDQGQVDARWLMKKFTPQKV